MLKEPSKVITLERYLGFAFYRFSLFVVKATALLAFLVGTSYATTLSFQPPASQFYENLAHATWIANGTGPKILYQVFDPNCPYCHALFEDLEPLIGPGHLTIREVPVGFLMPTSLGKAATILVAKHPLQVILRGEAHYVFRQGMGIRTTKPNRRVRAQLQHNLELIKAATTYPIVPILVYLKANGKAKFVVGLPSHRTLKAIVADIK